MVIADNIMAKHYPLNFCLVEEIPGIPVQNSQPTTDILVGHMQYTYMNLRQRPDVITLNFETARQRPDIKT